MGVRTRIDVVLVSQGLARSRTAAGALLRAGRVAINGCVITKASHVIDADTPISIAHDDGPEYVSRAGHKLAGALDALNDAAEVRAGRILVPVIEGSTCLDVGASTGGFTDVLLRRGARVVHALDVGHDQLDSGLRADPRVIVSEGVNVRDLTLADLPEQPGLIVGDLSFISLRLVIPVLARVAPEAQMLLMVKPQFEVGRERLGRGGVVRDPALHALAIADVIACAAEAGLDTRAVVASSMPGPSGNREFFCLFTPLARMRRPEPAAAPGGEGHVPHPNHVQHPNHQEPRSHPPGSRALRSVIEAAVADTGGQHAYFAEQMEGEL